MTEIEPEEEEKSFFSIIVHSFFIIPFLIAVFCLLLFAGMHLLTREKRSAFDYLEDVKTGGLNKRWQGAFELSKILSHPDLLPESNRFSNELIAAFEHAKHDDNRVRQYLALAMGRTGREEFVESIINGLDEEKEVNLPSLIYALGMLKDDRAVPVLYQYLEHSDPRIRSITTVSLGSIANMEAIDSLKRVLNDSEPNVRWGAALSLVSLGNFSGKEVITNLLDREYLSQFPEVDSQEQTHLMLSAIEATVIINDKEMLVKLEQISKTDSNMKVRAAALEAPPYLFPESADNLQLRGYALIGLRPQSLPA